MIPVDTNILLNAANADSPGHARCAAALEDILTLDRDFRTFPWVKLRPLPEV